MDKKNKKVVLAYSGGLDTSIIVHWLKEKYRYDVIAVAVNLGQAEELKNIRPKALKTGASKVYVEDLRAEFAKDYLFPMLKAGAIYEQQYLLGTAIARPLIAKKVIEIANKEKAEAVSHGCTGKGNDQVRFELTFKALNPNIKIIAPWREWRIKSREDEIKYARKYKIPVTATKEKPYSMDRNLWHISYEGEILEDPWREAPENIFLLTNSPAKAPNREEYVQVDFIKGMPVGINGKKLKPVNLIEKLNKIGGRHGIGRKDIVENRLVGIKVRNVYECPGGTILYLAHQALESITIDRETMHLKSILSQKYAELIYYGQWFTKIRKSLDGFFEETQKNVTGKVRLKLYKGNCSVVGRKAKRSLYQIDLATFDKDESYNQKDAEGFINLFGLPIKIEAMVKNRR
jgi:argininosuccinate synthase